MSDKLLKIYSKNLKKFEKFSKLPKFFANFIIHYIQIIFKF